MMSVLEYKFNTALHRCHSKDLSDLSAIICTHLLTNSTSVGAITSLTFVILQPKGFTSLTEAWEMAVVGEEAVINISERYIVSFWTFICTKIVISKKKEMLSNVSQHNWRNVPTLGIQSMSVQFCNFPFLGIVKMTNNNETVQVEIDERQQFSSHQ